MYDTRTHTVTPPRQERVSAADRTHEETRAPEAERQAVRSASNTPHGLCVTCALAADCTYRRGASRPVLCCDEFEGIQLAATPRRSAAVPIAMADESATDARARGLCAMCVHRDGCTFPRPEGGVWHCEEFE